MQEFPLACLLIGFAYVTAQTANLDDIIDDLYSNNNYSTTKPFSLQPLPGTGEACTCVAFYLCNNGTVNSNGEGLIDIRIDDDSPRKNPCGSAIDVCCDKKDQLEKPVTPAPLKTEGCGYRNLAGIGMRILGNGNEAEYGEFPWMVAILREEYEEDNSQKKLVYQCGGSLIHPKVVITAAHCIRGRNKKFIARVGEWDTQTTQELYPYQDREVTSIVSHPEFYSGALYNDIAILFLESPVELGRTINVICLPPKDTIFDDSSCVASGWGKEIYGKKGEFSVILKKVELPFVNRDTCQTLLRKTRVGKFFELHPSFICAGGEKGKDTCDGDGGSPLVCPVKGHRYVHAGIVAWGIDCGLGGTPGVYTNVALFKDWIDEQLTYNNIHERPYEY